MLALARNRSTVCHVCVFAHQQPYTHKHRYNTGIQCMYTYVCMCAGQTHTTVRWGWPPSPENFQIVAINDGVEVCVGVGGVLCAVNVCV
jgi:hypothetical protein